MTNYNPLISVIMNCYNSRAYLKEAIDSIFSQTYQNFEIIFWDNASTDDSAVIAKSFGDKVKYFRGEKNVSLGEARNFALEKISGELIAFLDCDDLWFPTKLEKQVKLFEKKSIGLVFSDTIFFNEDGDVKQLYKNGFYITGLCFNDLFTDYFLSLETVIIRASVLKELKYWFDPRFHMIEEADFFCRIALNYELAMIPEVLAKWRIHKRSWTWEKQYLFPVEREMMLNTYIETIPEFSKKYENEIIKFRKFIRFGKAKAKWSGGLGKEARELIRGDISTNLKSLALYILTFFPKNKVDRFLNILGKGDFN